MERSQRNEIHDDGRDKSETALYNLKEDIGETTNDSARKKHPTVGPLPPAGAPGAGTRPIKENPMPAFKPFLLL